MAARDPSDISEKRDLSLHNLSSDSADSENSESSQKNLRKKVKTDEINSSISPDTQRKHRQKRKRGATFQKHDKATRILYGEEQSSYSLYALIDDDVDEKAKDSERFSKQSLRLIEPKIQSALGLYSEDLTKEVAFKINRFKKGNAKYFTIEIEVYNETHLKKLLTKDSIKDFKVKIVENFNKNCVKGTFKDFRCDFNDETDDNIKDYFHQKGVKEVTDAKRLGKSDVILLHFRGQTKPESLDVGTRRFKIKTFYPKPSRCFKCQSYSHPRHKCKSKDFICFNCGVHYDTFEEHTPKTCKAKAKCVHCDEEHRTGNTKCKVEELEMKFQKIMQDQGLRRDEVKRRYPKGEVTLFADIVSRPIADLDFTFPTTPVDARSAPPRDEMVSPQSETITSILNQNCEILKRLERIEKSKAAPVENQVEQQVDETDDNELKKTLKELLARVTSLEEQSIKSNQKINQLQEMVVEKQATIDSQAEKIKKQETVIKTLQAKVVAAGSINDEPAKDLLAANATLIVKNSDLVEQLKILNNPGRKKESDT